MHAFFKVIAAARKQPTDRPTAPTRDQRPTTPTKDRLTDSQMPAPQMAEAIMNL